ncbi:hypothetical protein GALL_493100 [mine drainage metagenome]|uniref:Uncharacterized protein n=1 Tax=mine drainage metagenome TaxID=410659 RepID=A0A1J5PCY7_9ZZZZ
MRHDQAVADEGGLCQPGGVEGDMPEGLHQFSVAPGGNGEDELEPAPALIGQGCQLANIVEAQQPAIGDQDDALDREALQHGLQHSLQRLRFGHVAGMDGVHERQALGGLHHAEDELAGDTTGFLVHAERADILADLTFAVDAHGGQIVEDHREVMVNQRADLRGQFHLDPLGMVHQRIHGAQEVLMRDGLGHGGHRDGLEPAQAAQLACGIAQSVEHHRPDEGLDIELALARPQGAPERAIETEVFPQFMENKDVTEALRRVVGDRQSRRLIAACHLAEAADQGVKMTVFHAVDATKIGDDAAARLAGLVAEGLDNLQISPPATLCDPNEHPYKMAS